MKGSYLNQLFSPEFSAKLQKNGKGQYVLDFNPVCFGLIVDWLKNKQLSPTGIFCLLVGRASQFLPVIMRRAAI